MVLGSEEIPVFKTLDFVIPMILLENFWLVCSRKAWNDQHWNLDKILLDRDEGMSIIVWKKVKYIRTYRLESRMSKKKTIKYKIMEPKGEWLKVDYYEVRITKYEELFGVGAEIMKKKLVLRYILGLECSEKFVQYKHHQPLSGFYLLKQRTQKIQQQHLHFNLNCLEYSILKSHFGAWVYFFC